MVVVRCMCVFRRQVKWYGRSKVHKCLSEAGRGDPLGCSSLGLLYVSVDVVTLRVVELYVVLVAGKVVLKVMRHVMVTGSEGEGVGIG